MVKRNWRLRRARGSHSKWKMVIRRQEQRARERISQLQLNRKGSLERLHRLMTAIKRLGRSSSRLRLLARSRKGKRRSQRGKKRQRKKRRREDLQQKTTRSITGSLLGKSLRRELQLLEMLNRLRTIRPRLPPR